MEDLKMDLKSLIANPFVVVNGFEIHHSDFELLLSDVDGFKMHSNSSICEIPKSKPTLIYKMYVSRYKLMA